MEDNKLRQMLIDELAFEPSVDAAHIGVAVDEGVVTLSGHVKSYAEKHAAEQAVRRVRGVRAIAEEIRVRFPEDKKTADDEIAKRAVAILSWHSVVPSTVTVKVEKGWVHLGGTVDWQFQRIAAESAIRKLSGVVGVFNTIEIRASAKTRDVQSKIEEALKRNAELEASSIIVRVTNGDTVTLDGTVRAWFERDLAERAAWSAPGVKSVVDRLIVA